MGENGRDSASMATHEGLGKESTYGLVWSLVWCQVGKALRKLERESKTIVIVRVSLTGCHVIYDIKRKGRERESNPTRKNPMSCQFFSDRDHFISSHLIFGMGWNGSQNYWDLGIDTRNGYCYPYRYRCSGQKIRKRTD